MQTTKQLQRFYVVEVFRPQPPIPGSQGSETVSLPCGTSAFDRRQYTTRVNRARVEGTSPSTCARSRFPLHPSLPALDGVSIEGKDEEYFRHCDHTGFSFRSLRAFGHRAKNEEARGRAEEYLN